MSQRYVKFLFLGVSLAVVGGVAWQLTSRQLSMDTPLARVLGQEAGGPAMGSRTAGSSETGSQGVGSHAAVSVAGSSGTGSQGVGSQAAASFEAAPRTEALSAAGSAAAHVRTAASPPDGSSGVVASGVLVTPGVHHEAVATGLRLVQDDGQRQRWTLTAESAQKPDRGRTRAVEPRLTLFLERGSVLEVSAHEGTLDQQSREMAFMGDVHATDGGDLHLTTSLLRVDPARHLLETDQPFRLVGKGFELTGVGLEFNQDLQQVKVLQRVKAVILDGFRDLV
ncbi:MAG: LPS export ABC transporter periplasmic protein LptC [Magnetococcales bacterium]|nr:LPS export ABC transporter periplasmic protein LptC [Magnetococcales bacterium]